VRYIDNYKILRRTGITHSGVFYSYEHERHVSTNQQIEKGPVQDFELGESNKIEPYSSL